MDNFEHPYYALNKRLLLLIGQWPYQNSINRLSSAFFVLPLLLSLAVTQIALFLDELAFDTALEIVPPLTTIVTVLTKFFMLIIYRTNVKCLLEHIIVNWKLCHSKEEMDIMHEFGKEGEFLTWLYTIYIYVSMMLFLLLPFVPRVIDIIAPLNESRRLTPIFRGEYFVDEEEHFFYIYFHMTTVVVVTITILVTADVLFLIFNSHICGLFLAVGLRLEYFLNDQASVSQRICVKNVILAVQSHRRALEFAELIESSYSIPLAIQVTSCLICMSVSMFELLLVPHKTSEMFRYIAFLGAQLVHIFCMCYPGQRMIDYSNDIHFKAYSSLWYEAPIEVHKWIVLIMRKSLEPSHLTAGKVFVFCLESFASIVQTATSYFMVISSMH